MGVFSWTYDHRRGKRADQVLREVGALIRVKIDLPADLVDQKRQEQLTMPRPVTGLAMIDTGASESAVDHSVATQLELESTGPRKITGAGGKYESPIYVARFSFSGGLFAEFDGLQVTGENLAICQWHVPPELQPLGEVIALVGRDILQHLIFVYNGPAGAFTLAG